MQQSTNLKRKKHKEFILNKKHSQCILFLDGFSLSPSIVQETVDYSDWFSHPYA